jgi:hypothetical protein
MLPYKKVFLLIFSFVLIATVFLLILYYRESRGCFTELTSASTDFNISIKNKKLWQNYIDTIGNCKRGNFTVYSLSDKTPKQAKTIKYVISDEKQPNSLTTQERKVLYTYNITYDNGKTGANVIINFPDKNNLDGIQISSAISLVSYRLFTGEPYTARKEEYVKFNSPGAMGIIYEKRFFFCLLPLNL